MGASSWEYVTAYEGSVEQSLRALHQRVFDEIDHGPNADEQGNPLPDWTTLEDLWADEVFMGEVGTHTVLDVNRLIAADAQLGPYEHYGTIRPLTDDRLEHHFGTTEPTLPQYEEAVAEANRRIFQNRPTEPTLLDEVDRRWTGRYVILYTDGRPTHLGVFGYSGD